MNVEDVDGVDGAELGTSLRDDLRAAFDEIAGREGGAEDVAPTAEANAPAEPTDATEVPTGQPRDATGKFARADQQPADVAQTPADSTTPDAPAEQHPDGAPGSWRAAAKEKWSELPPEVKAEIAKREADITRAVTNIDNERRFAREMADVVRPHFETIKSFGVTPQVAVGALLKNDHVMRYGTPEQKIQVARGFIRDYGLDPQQLIDPNAPSDPHVIALQREVEHLRARQQIPQQFDHAPLPEAPGEGNVVPEIDAFRTDPAHPHFDQVAPFMATLIESGQAASLAEAYDKAVWATPALRSTLQAQQAPAPAPVPPQPSQAKRQNPADKVAAARHAGSSVGRSPGPIGEPAPGSLREELRSNLRASGWTG